MDQARASMAVKATALYSGGVFALAWIVSWAGPVSAPDSPNTWETHLRAMLVRLDDPAAGHPSETKTSGDTAKETQPNSVSSPKGTVEPSKPSGSEIDAERTPKSKSEPIRILAWNIESEGANPKVIAKELSAMPGYEIYGFSEVLPSDWKHIEEALGDEFLFAYSRSGSNDRLAYAIRKDRFEVIKQYEIGRFEDHIINPGNYRSPFVFELRDRITGIEFAVMLNHLARGKSEVRQRQARGLTAWAKAVSLPVIAIGDYNFDFEFSTRRGNGAFEIFQADETWKWVEPKPLIDSNWYDGDGDGKDDYEGSILDFAFLAGQAKGWNARSRVIVREGDFPDDDQTSDHRPIEVIVRP
ncbi:MAG: hypothetical protein AAF989_01850 [Planctomycetota bacterium]